MTTTTTTITTTLNIIKALPNWVKWSLTINAIPDELAPTYCLELTAEDLDIAVVANVPENKWHNP